jgi:hypothetical protein
MKEENQVWKNDIYKNKENIIKHSLLVNYFRRHSNSIQNFISKSLLSFGLSKNLSFYFGRE